MSATVRWSTVVGEDWPKYGRACRFGDDTCQSHAVYLRFTGVDDGIGTGFCTPHAAELGCAAARQVLVDRVHDPLMLGLLGFTFVMVVTMISLGVGHRDYALAEATVIGGLLAVIANMAVQVVRSARIVDDNPEGGVS